MKKSPFIDKIKPNKEAFISKQDKVSNNINFARKWHLKILQNILPAYIINKISIISVHVSNFEDKLACKFSVHGDFFIKNQQLGLT